MSLATLYASGRTDYYRALLAAGMSEDEARRHDQANALQRFRNRDTYTRDTHHAGERERRGLARLLGVR